MVKKITLGLLLLISKQAEGQFLNGMSPNSCYHSQSFWCTINATNLFKSTSNTYGNIWKARLRQGSYTYTFFDVPNNLSGNGMYVSDSNTAVFSSYGAVPATAPVGLYDLEVVITDTANPGTNLITYTAFGAYTVVAADCYLSGKVYFDSNENGNFDPGEPGIPYVRIAGASNPDELTDSLGNFYFGKPNGGFQIWTNSPLDHEYLISSDSATYTRAINNTNVSGLDFGLVDGITSCVPDSVPLATNFTVTVTSRSLFALGANSWGNITLMQIDRSTPPFGTLNIPLNSILVIDSNTATISTTISYTGVFDFRFKINALWYYLRNALSVTAPSFLSGHCYFDDNSNGVFDGGEPPIPNVRLDLTPESSYAYSDINGNYQFGAFLGAHDLAFSGGSSSDLILTSQPLYSFTNSGSLSGFDFGFRSTLPDYSATYSLRTGRPFCVRGVNSQISYRNVSNVVCQGEVYFVPDNNIILNTTSPVFSRVSGDTLFWDFINLQPFENRYVDLNFFYPGPGTTIQNNSGIRIYDGSGFLQFEDTVNIHEIVKCSFDPNDKTAIPEGENDIMHYTLNSEPVEYLIRFQNAGNDTAFTVFIRDTIDASFNLNTFEVVSSSHSMQTQVDSNRAVVFIFNNILLADSVVDEPNSHGYVRYRISPLANLPDPTLVENTAYIYFDLNPAVVTNTTWNTLVQMLPVGISDLIQVDEGVFFYPNPMDEIGYLSFKNPLDELIRLDLYDLKGQRVLTQDSKGSLFQIDRKGFSSGLYLFRLINTNSGKINSGKISFR